MVLVEELAARGWPAAETLRARRLAAAPHAVADPAALELGAPRRRRPTATWRSSRTSTRAAGLARSCRSPPPRRGRASTAELGRRGWSSEGRPTSSSPTAATVLARTAPGEVALAERPDAGWVAAWAACEERPDADMHAREVLARIEPATAYALAGEDLGVGLAVCERGWAGLFCVATAASARRRGIARSVVHALTALGRRARRAADLPTGRDRQRARARPLREHGLPALARLSLPSGPALGPALGSRSLRSAWSTSARTLEPAISLARSCWISR